MAEPPHILLVEDNELNRYLATFLLEQAGARVSQATTGVEGVRLARELVPDLVVMDIEMPEMDGYEAARQILGAPETSHIPIVCATSYAMPGERAFASQIGFADYIEKPIDTDTFAARVLRCLRPASSEPVDPGSPPPCP